MSTPTGGPYTSTTFTWTTAPTNPAPYTITGNDSAGNAVTTQLTFVSDIAAPTGSITAPTANASVGGSPVTVSSNSADSLSGVASARFQVALHSGAFADLSTDTTSPYQTTWDTTGYAAGQYDLQVVTTDKAGNTFTSPIVTVTVDHTAPTVTNVALASPGTAGTANKDDTLTIQYSEQMDATKLCSGWTNSGTQTVNGVTVTITDSGTNDTLTVSNGCTFSSIALGGDYVPTGGATFSGTGSNQSIISWSPTTNTLTITLGTKASGNVNTLVPAGIPAYTPVSGLTDLAGNALSTSPFHGTSSRF